MSCQATAADPSRRNAIVRCDNPNRDHAGPHRGRAFDRQLVTWGTAPGRRQPPGPDRDWFDAYASGDEVQIAAARARYSSKLQDAGFPGLIDELDEDGKR
jgi:hypothetical protein